MNSNGEVAKRRHPRVNSTLIKLPVTKNFSEAYLNPLQHIACFGEKEAGLFMFGLSLTEIIRNIRLESAYFMNFFFDF